MKENTTKYVLLGLLSRRPLTGYDIKKTVETRLDYIWDLSNGQIYPTLKSLEKSGFITKKVETKETGPTRKVYTITTRGTEELKEWLALCAHPEVNRYEILLKLIFGEHSNRDTNIEHVQAFKERNSKLFETMSQFERNLDLMPEQTEEIFYVRLAVLLGKKISTANLEWAETVLKMLNQRGGK